MPDLVIEIVLFVIGLVCLVKGGDWFVDSACGIAHRFNMPEILIGATVVSIGTTIPEVMVSATAALTAGASDMAYGNAIGSIICNTALIAAITMAFAPAVVDKAALKRPVIFFFISAAFYVTVAITMRRFTRPVGIVLLTIFLIYMIVCVHEARKNQTAAGGAADVLIPVETPVDPAQNRMTDDYVQNVINAADGADAQDAPGPAPEGTQKAPASSDKDKQSFMARIRAKLNSDSLARYIIFLILGAAIIAVGADLLVDNGTLIATAIGVPQSVIALTFVALGTSLPELVTAISALVKGHSALSLGNVIGANLFNLVLVSGLAITLAPFHIPEQKTIAGYNASIVMDIPVMLAVMLIMCIPTLVKGRIYRLQGICLLTIYFAYVIFQFV